MTEIFSPNVELPKPPEAIGRAELEEVLRRARAPTIRGDFVEPWTEDPANFDPAQAGWEQAAGNLLTKIQEMQSSGLVQLTPEGLTPRQAAEKAGESAKLAEADKRAAELAEQLQRQQAAGNARRQPVEEPEPSPRDQWNQFADDQRNADLGEWYKKLQAGEPIEDWQKQALKDFNIWGGDSPPSAAEAEEADEAVIPPARERKWPRELSISAEGMKLALKNYLSTWLNRMKVSFLTELGVGTGAGFLANMAFTELVAKNPKMATILPLALTQMQVFGGLFTGLVEAGALDVLAIRRKFEIAGKYARTSSLAERIAVTKSADGLVDWSLLAFASATKALRDTLIRPATAGFTAGAWLYAALAGAGVFGEDHQLINGADAVAPVASGGGAGEGVVAPSGGQGESQWPDEPRFIGQQSGEGAVVQPPTESGGVAAGVGPGGASSAEELQQMAEAAQGAAEMAARQAALEAATRTVMVNPGDTLTGLIDAAGGNAYGKDFTDTVLQSANILTGPQNPNRDMAKALIDFIKANPDGVNWRDAINGVGDLARQTVGGLPLKDAIAQATRMIYPGQEMKIVVGAMP